MINPLMRDKLPEHVQRMAEEAQQVITRYRNLAAFVHTKTFKELLVHEQALMFDQLEQMAAYAKTLSLRYCLALLDHG